MRERKKIQMDDLKKIEAANGQKAGIIDDLQVI